MSVNVKILSFFSLLLLVGCGGGDGTADNGSAGGAESAPTSQAPSGPRLTIQTNTKNLCGVRHPQTDSALVVHNDDFSTRSIHYPDATGSFAVDLDTETASISVLSKRRNQFQAESIQMNTFVNVSEIDLGVLTNDYIDSNDADCECVSQDVLITNNIEPGAPISVGFGTSDATNGEFIGSGYLLENERLCRPRNGSWPILSATLSFRFTGRRVYSGKVSDYDVSNRISIPTNTLSELVPATVQSVTAQTPGLRSLSVIGNDYHNYGWYGLTSRTRFAIIYQDPDVDHTEVTVSQSSSSTTVRSVRSVASDVAETIDFSFLRPSIFVGTNISGVGLDTYDYSFVPDAERLSLVTNVLDRDSNLLLRWDINSPVTGSLAGIENFDIDDVNFSVDNTSLADRVVMSLTIFDFEGLSIFDDYINYNAEASRSEKIVTRNYKSATYVTRVDDIPIVLSKSAADVKIENGINVTLLNTLISNVQNSQK